ncbi:MAG: thiamine pyrophosphate-binding protein [Hyphomicrobiaceae bacterium]
MSGLPDNSATPEWVRGLHAVLGEQKVRQVCHVPDGGNAPLIALCNRDATMTVVTLTREEEGVAMCCGAWLGGDRAALLLQSSGVGNCINALAMVRTCAFPLLAIVSMRGEYGEFMPWQVPMGQATPAVLSAIGVIVQRVDEPKAVVPMASAAAKLAFDSSVAVALLLSQRLIGTKRFVQ